MSWQAHISVDPNVMHGVACVAGTRVPVSVVLASLAAGVTEERILAEYPSVSLQAIAAALAYAAESAPDDNEPTTAGEEEDVAQARADVEAGRIHPLSDVERELGL